MHRIKFMIYGSRIRMRNEEVHHLGDAQKKNIRRHISSKADDQSLDMVLVIYFWSSTKELQHFSDELQHADD